MVYVTHDQTEALTFADKVVVMYDGEVVQIGTPQELFEQPGAHVRRLFHRLAGHERAAGRGRRATRPVSAATTIALGRAYGRLDAGKKIEIGIRPEFLRLRRARRAAR